MRQASPFALALLAATSLAGSPAFAQEDAATSAALERLDAALPTDERINTLLAVAHGLHLFTRNSRIPAYERALTVTGALFGALKTRVCVLHHSTEMRRRVLNFQRAFRYWKLFKKVAIKVFGDRCFHG